jgi:hypothetical protein
MLSIEGTAGLDILLAYRPCSYISRNAYRTRSTHHSVDHTPTLRLRELEIIGEGHHSVMERVSDGSIGATNISKSRCPGLSGSKSSALLEPVWF